MPEDAKFKFSTLVILPCWSTVNLGICNDEPYIPEVTVVSDKLKYLSVERSPPPKIPLTPDTIVVLGMTLLPLVKKKIELIHFEL